MKSFMIVGAFVALFSLSASAADPVKVEGVKVADTHVAYWTCAKACGDCQIQCDMCFKHCSTLVADGKVEHAKCAQLCIDCGDCCKLASSLSAVLMAVRPARAGASAASSRSAA